VSEKPEAPEAPASIAERIVIRDKRKVGKAAVDSSAAGQERAASPEPGEAPQAVDGELVAAGEAHDVPVTVSGTDTAAGSVSGTDTAAGSVSGTDTVAEKAAEAVSGQDSAALASAEVGELRSTLDERTADLQRVTAEYANYRKRVERDRMLATEQAVAMVLVALLPVLDDIDRARDHGDLTGPFASVAEQLTTIAGKLGLTGFGAKGDAFDPKRHEAVAHQTSADVTEPTCIDVMRRGYLLGERLLRPAMVAVADPAE
jgi:molecular chaperone GrpE